MCSKNVLLPLLCSVYLCSHCVLTMFLFPCCVQTVYLCSHCVLTMFFAFVVSSVAVFTLCSNNVLVPFLCPVYLCSHCVLTMFFVSSLCPVSV